MQVSFVIDNQTSSLSGTLNNILSAHIGKALDITTAYFNMGGFKLLREGLAAVGSFRLILGSEPREAADIGLQFNATDFNGLLRRDLEVSPFDDETQELIEELVRFLSREKVQVRSYDKGFLHAKCWLFYHDRGGLIDRLQPILAIVGSSNFTRAGLTSNSELNLVHKVLLEPEEVDDKVAAQSVKWLAEDAPSSNIKPENKKLIKSEVGARAILELADWYERQWVDSRDFKDELIELLNASKYGEKEYTPYEVYMKALYEYFKDDLDTAEIAGTRSAVELSEFQEDAVRKARKILMRYNGVMVADSVGLGKTWIGKKLLEDYAYHMRQKATVIAPASLLDMWRRELKESTISALFVSQEKLGQEDADVSEYADSDVILIDESHNFRNKDSNRYGNIERLIGAHSGCGRDGVRKKVILLTATPINNTIFDLYNQVMLITQGDKGYFSAAGIGDLHRYFIYARRNQDPRYEVPGATLFNLLEEIVIRRTRQHIREAYPEALIRGKKVSFPKRKLKTIHYDLEATYEGIYEFIVNGIESLNLAQYKLEKYKKTGIEIDEMELGREEALVGIFKSRYLKRFESSIEAFKISIRRALSFLKTFESYFLDGKILGSKEFQSVLRYVEAENEEDDATPTSLSTDLDENIEARAIMDSLASVDPALYDSRKLHDALEADKDTLTDIWMKIKDIKPEQDAKLQRLKELLSTELRGQKLLVFTYYKDTVRYLYRNLGDKDFPSATSFMEDLGNVTVRRMDSDISPNDRLYNIRRFSPVANNKPEWKGTEQEIDILFSTDVLSEGQNLQDCGLLINYDLHWNPTRMVQRAGRIDRIGTDFDTLWIYNMFPDEGLERLLHIVESLHRKIANIDREGLHDASILGELVHPRSFNVLKRIRDEESEVVDETEEFTELASNEFLQRQLQQLLDAGGLDKLTELPDGIHSGLIKQGVKGVFFYFKAVLPNGNARHFWRFLDLDTGRIVDNRFYIANLIACSPDTPRYVDSDMHEQRFDYHDQVLEDVIDSVKRQIGIEAAPGTIDPIQNTVRTELQQFLVHPKIKRPRLINALKFLEQPMLETQKKRLRKAFEAYGLDEDIITLVHSIEDQMSEFGFKKESPKKPAQELTEINKENLRLICFDFISR